MASKRFLRSRAAHSKRIQAPEALYTNGLYSFSEKGGLDALWRTVAWHYQRRSCWRWGPQGGLGDSCSLASTCVCVSKAHSVRVENSLETAGFIFVSSNHFCSGNSSLQRFAIFLGVDSPFFSTIVLFNKQPISLGFRRFSRKKDPWKERGRYPWNIYVHVYDVDVCTYYIHSLWQAAANTPIAGHGSLVCLVRAWTHF